MHHPMYGILVEKLIHIPYRRQNIIIPYIYIYIYIYISGSLFNLIFKRINKRSRQS